MKIYSSKKTKLLDALSIMHTLEYIEKPSFVSSLFKKEIYEVDLYIYDGKSDKWNIQLLQNAKTIIVNSNAQKEYVSKKYPFLSLDSIKVVYPYIDQDIFYDKQIKKDFKKHYKIDKKTKIIFFRSKDISKNGIKQFLSIVSNLTNKNFVVVVESVKSKIEELKLQLGLMKIDFRVILIEDYKNKNELFMISDIFVFPSKLRFFNLDILKAAFYKNAIFVSQNNYSSEVVDFFANIELDNDEATIFKIDALLSNPKDLKVVKQTNLDTIKTYDFTNSFEMLKEAIC